MATQAQELVTEIADGIRKVRGDILKELKDELGFYKVIRPPMGEPDDRPDGHRTIYDHAAASWAGSPGRVLDGAFDSFGDFVRQISPRALTSNGLPSAMRNLSSVDPSGGGFLLPEAFRSELLNVALTDSIIRPLATVIPMNSARQIVPGIDATSNETTVFGGVDAQWIEEGGTFTDSGPRFARIVLQANKLGLRTDVPSELLQDASPALDVILMRMFASALAFEEDWAFIRGNGVGQPLGILNSSALVTVDKEAGQTADTICIENLNKMFARMLSRSRPRAIWIASDSCIPELLTLSLAVGTGGAPIPVLNEKGGKFGILGRPVYFTEHCPVVGDHGDIMFIDPAFYLVGDRSEIRLEASEHVKFLSDEVVFRGIERVDGRSWLQSAIVPRNGGASQSAFVALAAR